MIIIQSAQMEEINNNIAIKATASWLQHTDDDKPCYNSIHGSHNTVEQLMMDLQMNGVSNAAKCT